MTFVPGGECLPAVLWSRHVGGQNDDRISMGQEEESFRQSLKTLRPAGPLVVDAADCHLLVDPEAHASARHQKAPPKEQPGNSQLAGVGVPVGLDGGPAAMGLVTLG